MKTDTKKAAIKKHTLNMLKESYEAMKKQVDKALNCGAIDTEAWDRENAPMITPRIIVKAILESEATQFEVRGTKWEKEVKDGVKNLRYYI